VKIEKNSNPLPTAPLNDNKASVAQKSGSRASPQESTSVSLGSTASQLRSMEEGLSGGSSINAAKVAEIKQAISEGRFKVNSEVVADRLINTVRELIREGS
jgi:negative regulator of flagellin synthesis FlgM